MQDASVCLYNSFHSCCVERLGLRPAGEFEIPDAIASQSSRVFKPLVYFTLDGTKLTFNLIKLFESMIIHCSDCTNKLITLRIDIPSIERLANIEYINGLSYRVDSCLISKLLRDRYGYHHLLSLPMNVMISVCCYLKVRKLP